jgi:sporulation protein YlmC with PRC-barrel domain
MLEKIGNIKGLEIYTPGGIFVGIVDEVVIDLPQMSIAELFVIDANPALVDESASIGIPFRWIQSIGDIVILNRFPTERVGTMSA